MRALGRTFTWIVVGCAISSATPLCAQGFSLETTSMDTTMAISNSVLANQIAPQAVLRKQGLSSGRRGYAAAPSGSAGVLGFATQARSTGRVASVQTSFRRTAAATAEAKQNILRAVANRQPDALKEYKQKLPAIDFASGFRSVAGPYGLSANDAADTLTGYWVMAWVVANGAALPDPKAVRAARSQVVQGFARTPVGAYAPHQRQVLADEAIFNFLVLNQAWRTAKGADAKRLADATQRNFLPLGANLRQLKLTGAGFTR